jgi:DNA-binding MarR family transcriptional regulator
MFTLEIVPFEIVMSRQQSGTLRNVRPEDPWQAAGAGADACAIPPMSPDLVASDVGGACAEKPDLAGLDDAELRQVLVGQTARFATGFLRWMEARSGDGLNYARMKLLQTLHCRGPAIMRDLGSELGATPRNMTAIVDAMEEAGLVVRRPHPTDRRATLIELSPDGTRAAAQAIGPQLDAIAEVFTDLTPAEQERFSAIVAKLLRAMRGREPQC